MSRPRKSDRPKTMPSLLRLPFLGLAGLFCWDVMPSRANDGRPRRSAQATVEDRLREYGPQAEERLTPHFASAGVAYPPARVALIGLKRERQLELWASQARDGDWKRIRSYPILAASGGPGPKLRRGDMQVPEGFYRIEMLNPNSRYHLSLRLNYPNSFDRARAAEDGRDDLGSDIMIHGRAVSAGCIALGDPAAEEIFTLAARVGLESVEVILAPVDFRQEPVVAAPEGAPAWLEGLYKRVAQRLKEFE